MSETQGSDILEFDLKVSHQTANSEAHDFAMVVRERKLDETV